MDTAVPKRPDAAAELRRALPWSLRVRPRCRRRRRPLVGVAAAAALVTGGVAFGFSDFLQKEIAVRRLADLPLRERHPDFSRLALLVECGRGVDAERLARALKDPAMRSETLLTIASARANRGERRAASALIDEARAAVNEERLSRSSAVTGISLPITLAEAGRDDEALALARSSEEPVPELAGIAAVFERAARKAEARELLREARERVTARPPFYQAIMLCTLACAYGKAGETEEALACLRAAEEAAGKTEAGSADMARAAIFSAMARLGRFEEARDVLARLAPADEQGALLALAREQVKAAPTEARATLRELQGRLAVHGYGEYFERASIVGGFVAIGDVDAAKEMIRGELEREARDFGGRAFGATKNPAAARELGEWMLESARSDAGLGLHRRARYFEAALPLLAADAPLWRVRLLHARPPAELRKYLDPEHGGYASIDATIVREYLERHNRAADARLAGHIESGWGDRF